MQKFANENWFQFLIIYLSNLDIKADPFKFQFILYCGIDFITSVIIINIINGNPYCLLS